MNNKIAKGIVGVFHPKFMAVYFGLFIIINDSLNTIYPLQPLNIISIFILFYLFLPLTTIYIIQKTGYISSVSSPSKRDKILTNLLLAFYYYIGYLILSYFRITSTIEIFLILLLIVFILLTIIQFVFKSSSHAIFMGSCIGILLFWGYKMQLNYLYIILVLLFLCGWIFTAQLTLNQYKPKQIYIPFLVGLIGFLGIFLYLFH